MSKNNAGRIELIAGPMFSGKSSDLFARVRKHRIIGRSTIVLKSSIDTRSDQDTASTHDKLVISARPVSAIADVMDELMLYDVIAIDEGQFFDDLTTASTKLALSGKIIIIAALNCDFKGEPFPSVLALGLCVESLTLHTSVCVSCKSEQAVFSHRISNETASVVIGGNDKYVPLCRHCFGNK